MEIISVRGETISRSVAQVDRIGSSSMVDVQHIECKNQQKTS